MSQPRSIEYRAAISTGCTHRRTGDDSAGPSYFKMSKRALLLDKDNELIGHPTFAEVDDYMARGLVERLTPVKAKTHIFRLIDRKAQCDAETTDVLSFDECSLSASTSRANAGAAEMHATLWAKRRVRIWPYIGDTRAPRVAIRTARSKPRPGRLQGEEKEALRRACFERDGYRCVDCGRPIRLELGHSDTGEMAHIRNRRMWGDSLDNVRTKCGPWAGQCHHREHVYGASGVKPCPPKVRMGGV